MKQVYTSIILLITMLFSAMAIAQETQKNFINYQGVARFADNELMVSKAMTIGIAIKFGGANAATLYEENHSITSDANGVFSLLIGNGSPVNGDYNALPWGSAATFVAVSMNGSEIGTTEMMAVPYAISAGSAGSSSAAELPYDNSISGLGATNTQAAIDELVSGGSVDADADPTNEFQTLNFDAATNELSLTNGNAVTIPSGGTDADADPTNEIQTISFDATSNEISLTDGGTITIPSAGTDADADPENELQLLSFDAATNALSLSNGNSVTIPNEGSGSSLWSEKDSNVHYNLGNVGIGLSEPFSPLHIVSENQASLRLETTIEKNFIRYSNSDGYQGYVGQWTGINDMDFGTGFGNSTGKVHLTTQTTPRLTVSANGNVGVGTTVPEHKLDVNGGFNISGDFVNQSVHKLGFLRDSGTGFGSYWTPRSSDNGVWTMVLGRFGSPLDIEVPEGSKVMLSFSAIAEIDSDFVEFRIIRDGHDVIAQGHQACYSVAGSREIWHISLDGLDAEVTPGRHTYRAEVFHSDDAEDSRWGKDIFYAVVIKE